MVDKPTIGSITFAPSHGLNVTPGETADAEDMARLRYDYEWAADELAALRARVTEAERLLAAVAGHIRLTDLLNAEYDCGFNLRRDIGAWIDGTSLSAGAAP